MAKKQKVVKVNLLKNVSDIFIRRDDIYSKFEKLYLKDKERYDEAIKNQRLLSNISCSNDSEEEAERRRIVLSVISDEPEDKIIKILDKYYHDIIQQVKNKVKFEECKLSAVVSRNIEYYIIYKFISIMINEDDTLTEQDQYMLILIDKMNNYYKDEIKLDGDLDLTMSKKTRAYCTLPDYIDRSPELYSFIISVILSNDMSLEEIESVRLNDKDEEDIMYYIKELIFYNQKEMSPLFFKKGETIYTLPYVTLKADKISNTFFHTDDFRNLVLISALIKIFAKVNHKYKDKYNDLYKKYKSLVAINENRIQDKKDIENINNLRKEIEKLKEDNKNLTIEKERLNKRYDTLIDENSKLKDNIKVLNNDIDELTTILSEIEVESEEEDQLTSQVDRIVLTEEEANNTVLVGGHARFQQKVLEKYPNIKTITIDVARVNEQLIKNSKLVLLYVKYMSHKIYESTMNIIRKNNIEYRYIN